MRNLTLSRFITKTRRLLHKEAVHRLGVCYTDKEAVTTQTRQRDCYIDKTRRLLHKQDKEALHIVTQTKRLLHRQGGCYYIDKTKRLFIDWKTGTQTKRLLHGHGGCYIDKEIVIQTR